MTKSNLEDEEREQDAAGAFRAEFAALGGKASAARMTPAQRAERARKAAEARWKGHTYSMKPHAVWVRKRNKRGKKQ